MKKQFKERCPFCGRDNELDVVVQEDLIPKWYHMHCDSCGATGPDCLSEIDAVMFWNRRNHPPYVKNWKDYITWLCTFQFDPHQPCPYAYVFGCLFVWEHPNYGGPKFYIPRNIRFGGFAPD